MSWFMVVDPTKGTMMGKTPVLYTICPGSAGNCMIIVAFMRCFHCPSTIRGFIRRQRNQFPNESNNTLLQCLRFPYTTNIQRSTR